MLTVEAYLQGHAQLGERRALRQRHQVLPSNVSASTLDASLVVTLAGPAEPWLESVVRREGREAWPQYPRRAYEYLDQPMAIDSSNGTQTCATS